MRIQRVHDLCNLWWLAMPATLVMQFYPDQWSMATDAIEYGLEIPENLQRYTSRLLPIRTTRTQRRSSSMLAMMR